ncbi:transglutaminase family protein [Herbaspirillum sp. RTI4]|uniref:transglutaminase family protein n=1 Tax=Herbaspirillum sp. RTI4 TaxID=3048640 RepID=UPI002AB5BDEE|nr:transglutaminase family protein [Herbaspirillum sp. RTI4]MDY7576831.1 transglutaminase family protein [Herbaspirillum sp. RTI4]MEA9981427.1 transglutaminase family protein [Herbaspirillum sp. RTI4]
MNQPGQQSQSQSQSLLLQEKTNGACSYHILHETSYTYSAPVRLSHQILRLTPRSLPWQICAAHHMHIAPEPHHVRLFEDSFGNSVQAFSLDSDHISLNVFAESRVELSARPQMGETPQWEAVGERFVYHAGYALSEAELEAARYLFESTHVRNKREFSRYAQECFTPGRSLLEGVEALMLRIYTEFSFDPDATTVSTPVTEVFANKRGVCQDFAHFMLSCLRSMGLPARYVSGYLLTEPPPGEPRLVGADASHAWVAVYCPGIDGQPGFWIEADPTNGIFAGTSHIILGWGRDFLDVSPLRGVLIGGGQQTMKVAVTVTPT